MKPSFFMIVDFKNEKSVEIHNRSKKSWEDHGITLNYFQAVTPEDLQHRDDLKFAPHMQLTFHRANKPKRTFTETEKACWYSHFDLWKLCQSLNGPVVILEHDAVLYQPFPDDFDWETCAGIGYNHDKSRVHICVAYLCTPRLANRLISISTKKEIDLNQDGYVHSSIRKLSDKYYAHAYHQLYPEIGWTVEHNSGRPVWRELGLID